MTDDERRATVSPYLVEKELERRCGFPLEELRALVDAVSEALDEGEISDELFGEFLHRMGLELEYHAYWAEDWELFEMNEYEWATP